MDAESSERPDHRIVVGVDGSVPSRAALAWAVRQASLTDARVEAFIAWEAPMAYGTVLDVDQGDAAARILDEAVAEIAPMAGSVPIGRTVVKGNAARSSWTLHSELICLLSAAAGTAASLRHCWGRSASTASTMPRALWW